MMLEPKLTADHRRIHLWSEFGADRLRLMELRGREQLSQPYRFRLRLRTSNLDRISLEQLTGLSVRASFQLPSRNWASLLEADLPTATRDFCGVLSRISLKRIDDLYCYYTATLRPRLWRLSLNRRYRMFSQKTTKEIVAEVLGELAVRWELSHPTAPHNYCVQYGESDLVFIHRLLEEDGLFYFFEHQYAEQPDDPMMHVERMVITDSIEAVNPPEQEEQTDSDDAVASSVSNALKIPRFDLDEVQGGVRDMMRIHRWQETRTLTPTGVQSLDRHFQRPDVFFRSVKNLGDSQAEPALTVMDYPSGVARRNDNISPAGSTREQVQELDLSADRDAGQKRDRLGCLASRYCGASDIATMAPGLKFKVARDFVLDTNAYYLTRVEHLVRLASDTHSGSDRAELLYKNRFSCQAAMDPFRPARRTKRPRIDGLVTAKVVVDPTITSDDVCVDIYGRVKVKFPWQEPNDDPSCWIRVSQFWAGPRFGAFFWPRAGHEVLVAFEHGDPDRPLIVGSVYNNDNMPPLTLPKHKLSNGVHSCSHKGNPVENSSCVVFHDRQGEEYLQLHSETFQSLSSETMDLQWAAGDEVAFKGHHWLFDSFGSSGGGGSDYTGQNRCTDAGFKKPDDDWSGWEKIGELCRDILPEFGGTSTKFTVGDSYAKKLGRNFETYFGCNIWLGCDPIELVECILNSTCAAKPLVPLLAPLILGAGGQGKTLFGGSHDLQYGSQVSVRRGPEYANSSEKLWETINGNVCSWENLAAKLCEVSVLICLLLDMAAMLITRAAVASDGSSWKGYISFHEVWSRSLLPRIQGVIEFVEEMIAKMKTVEAAAKCTLSDSEDALIRSIRACVTTDLAAADSVEATGNEIVIAVDGVRITTKHLRRCALSE